MFRNTSDNTASYQFESNVFANYKSNTNTNQQPKTYTPIRARLQGTGLNSTPIAAKLSQRTMSPILNKILSKQNIHGTSNLVSKSPAKQMMLSKSRVNESDDMFNSKSGLNTFQPLSTPSSNWKGLNSQYSSTPGGINSKPTISKISMNKNPSCQQDNILQSKGFQNFGKKNSIQSGSPLLANLMSKRQSNGFNNLSKPNQHFSNNCQNFQNSRKHYQTNVFSKFKGNQQQFNQQTQIMCMNNDNKKAKYQVLNNSDGEQDSQTYYYCAKCAIQLIQQGFKVQQIQTFCKQESAYSSQLNDIIERLQETNNRIFSKQSKLQNILKSNDCNYEHQLGLVDTYYNSLIDMIENMRSRDKNTIMFHKQKSQKSVTLLFKKIENGINQICQMNHQLNTRPDIFQKNQDNYYSKLNDFDALIIEPEIIQNKEIVIYENDLQDRYDRFIDEFEGNFAMNIIINKTQQARQGVSFSFEKARPSDRKISPMQQYIPQQDDKIISEDEEIQQTKQPFRNLFPDQSESQSIPFEGIQASKNNDQQMSDMMSGFNSDDGTFNPTLRMNSINGMTQDEDNILLDCNEDQPPSHSPSFKKI